jgi:hypothetical protein
MLLPEETEVIGDKLVPALSVLYDTLLRTDDSIY